VTPALCGHHGVSAPAAHARSSPVASIASRLSLPGVARGPCLRDRSSAADFSCAGGTAGGHPQRLVQRFRPNLRIDFIEFRGIVRFEHVPK